MKHDYVVGNMLWAKRVTPGQWDCPGVTLLFGLFLFFCFHRTGSSVVVFLLEGRDKRRRKRWELLWKFLFISLKNV